MDLQMPDADSVDQMSQADELDQSDHSSEDRTPEPSAEPDTDSDTSISDEDDPPQPDPNDLYKDDVKIYDSTTLVIVDAAEPGAAFGHDDGESIHKHACRTIETTFRDISTFGIEKICLPQNSSEADFFAAIDGILQGKTKKDLLIFHYHGSAGGVEHNYRWRFEGYPRGGVNAYNLVEKLCNSLPDSMLLLDCYIHDKLQEMWKLRTGNVELVTLKCKIQDGAGRLIHADDGYLTEGVCRNLKAYLRTIMSLDVFEVARRKPRSIPHAMGRDYTIKSRSVRIWFSRTGKHHKNLCLRFLLDPQRVWNAGEIIFDGVCIGPPRSPPPPAPLPALPLETEEEEESTEDEGFEDDTSMVDSVMEGMSSSAGSDDGNGVFVAP